MSKRECALKTRTVVAGILGCLLLLRPSWAGDELYRFSGKKELKDQQQAEQQAGQVGPQVQLWQQDQTTPESSTTRQQAGSAATSSSILNSKGGPPGTDQLPEGTKTPLPGGGPKLGVGPVGPGGTSRATTDPNEGPNRYAGRPPSWDNLNEVDAGRNTNAPGEGNTSSASGYNIFGATAVPFALGPGNR